MIATNVTIEDLVKAERASHVILTNVRKLSEKRYSFVLRPTPYKYPNGDHVWQRRSTSWLQDERRVFAVCWHGHRQFLENLFDLRPDAIVRSHIGREKVVHRGKVNLDTANIPLGPPITGGYPRACEACSCPNSGGLGIFIE